MKFVKFPPLKNNPLCGMYVHACVATWCKLHQVLTYLLLNLCIHDTGRNDKEIFILLTL